MASLNLQKKKVYYGKTLQNMLLQNFRVVPVTLLGVVRHHTTPYLITFL